MNKPSFLESTFVELRSNNSKNTIVGCIYKDPSMDISEFNNFFECLLVKVSRENKKLVLLGDFNINLLHYQSHTQTNCFVELLNTYTVLPHINLPIRITSSSETLIDNIFSNFNDHHCKSGNITSTISDHLPQFAIFEQINLSKQPFNQSYRDWNNFNQNDFVLDLFYINWTSLLEVDKCDIDFFFNSFYDKLNFLIDLLIHVPLKTYSSKRSHNNHKPWMSRGLLKSIKVRDSIYKRFLQGKDHTVKSYLAERYKFYRNMIVNLCRASKKIVSGFLYSKPS